METDNGQVTVSFILSKLIRIQIVCQSQLKIDRILTSLGKKVGWPVNNGTIKVNLYPPGDKKK